MNDFWLKTWDSAEPVVGFCVGVIGLLVFIIIVCLLLRALEKITGWEIIKTLFR